MPIVDSYVVRRIAHGLAMYILLVLAFSLIFNQVADRALRAQIEEETVRTLQGAGTLDPAAWDALKVQTRLALIARFHLDEPWLSRVLWRVVDVLGFQFGQASTIRSAQGDRGVLGIILEALPATLLLFGTEAILVMAAGVLVGILAARAPRGLVDRALHVLPMLLRGLPVWWMAMLAIMTFSYTLGWFPSGGMRANPAPEGFAGILDRLWHLALPLGLLVILNLWGFALEVRNLVTGLIDSPWVRAARGRGIPERSILFRHVLAGAKAPLATLVVMGLMQSLTGNLLVEGIFGWPGLGNLYFVAVQQSDVPVLLGVLSFQAFLNLTGYVGLDILYRFLDPRVAAHESGSNPASGRSGGANAAADADSGQDMPEGGHGGAGGGKGGNGGTGKTGRGMGRGDGAANIRYGSAQGAGAPRIEPREAPGAAPVQDSGSGVRP